jgi:hypothetical protein
VEWDEFPVVSVSYGTLPVHCVHDATNLREKVMGSLQARRLRHQKCQPRPQVSQAVHSKVGSEPLEKPACSGRCLAGMGRVNPWAHCQVTVTCVGCGA